MSSELYSNRYVVRAYECAPDGTIRLPQVLNFLQETASNHAASLGFDFPVLDEATGRLGAWVLAQIRIRMDHYPRWRDEVVVETFPHSVKAMFAHRDFRLSLVDGTPCGIATSRWMVLDPAVRRAVRVPASVGERYHGPGEPFFGPGDPFSKLRYPEAPGPESAREYRVMRSHIDLNGHVNNVHYAAWMLESIPEETSARLHVSEMELVFRSETLYGESIRSVCTPQPGGEGIAFAHRVSTPDGSRDHLLGTTRWAVL